MDLERLRPLAGAARDLLHRSGALAVRVAVDRGDGLGPAVISCERFADVEIIAGEGSETLAHGADLPAPELPAVGRVPPVQVDPAEGRVAAPLGALHGMAEALTALADLAGARSVAAAELETDHDELVLGLAARRGEPTVVTLGDAEYELPGP